MRYQFNRRAVINRRAILGLALGATLAGVAVAPVRADDTIKVGILHSLSGTMAISETTLKDVMLMLIDEQNQKGGLLGLAWRLRFDPCKRLCTVCRASNRRTSRCTHPSLRSSDRLPDISLPPRRD